MWTLVGVAAATERMLSDTRLRGSWAVVFLFPAFFIADSNLSGSADHVLGFFAVPIALSALHACDGFRRGPCAVLAIVLAGAVLTKYQAIYLLAGSGLFVGAVWLRAWFRELRGRELVVQTRRNLILAPVVLVCLGLVLVSPHFIKNAVFHRNPFYPFLQEAFSSTWPTFENSAFYVENLFKANDYVPPGTLFDKLWHAAKLFFTFSFDPHYAAPPPHFGSLFTLLLPTLLFGAGRRAIAPFAVMASVALFAWAFTFNVDRNLQAFMPLMAAVTGALLIRAWRFGWLARLGLVPLVGLKLIWAGDMPFLEGRGRIEQAVTLIASGRNGNAAKRLESFRRDHIGAAGVMPADAKVLSHLSYDVLGYERETLLDRRGFQSLIDYRKINTVRELFELHRSFGITHLVFDARERYPDAQRDEILINVLSRKHAQHLGNFGELGVYALPSEPPPAGPPYRVLALGVTGYADGLYPIDRMTTVEGLPSKLRTYAQPAAPFAPEQAAALVKSADVVLISASKSLDGDASTALEEFEPITTWGEQCTFFLRKGR